MSVKVDSTWSTAFDFSGQSAGDTFSVTVNVDGTQYAFADGGYRLRGHADGDGNRDADRDFDADASPTKKPSPGFGAVIAIVALIGAALFAAPAIEIKITEVSRVIFTRILLVRPLYPT